MLLRSFLLTAFLLVSSLAAAQGATGNTLSISDEMWRNSVYQGYARSSRLPYSAWHGAFNALDEERYSFGSGFFTGIRSGNHIHKFSNRWGVGVTTRPDIRSIGFMYVPSRDTVVSVGMIRLGAIGMRGAGISASYSFP